MRPEEVPEEAWKVLERHRIRRAKEAIAKKAIKMAKKGDLEGIQDLGFTKEQAEAIQRKVSG